MESVVRLKKKKRFKMCILLFYFYYSYIYIAEGFLYIFFTSEKKKYVR